MSTFGDARLADYFGPDVLQAGFVIVPLSALVGDRDGLTRAYMACLILFCIASAMCGLAWNLESEIVFRIIQAIPGGVLPVVTLPLVYRIVPRESIGSAMGIYGVGILFAPGIGPTLGGYLVEYVDWRLVFFINVPVGIVAALAAYFLLPPTAPTSTRYSPSSGSIVTRA